MRDRIRLQCTVMKLKCGVLDRKDGFRPLTWIQRYWKASPRTAIAPNAQGRRRLSVDRAARDIHVKLGIFYKDEGRVAGRVDKDVRIDSKLQSMVDGGLGPWFGSPCLARAFPRPWYGGCECFLAVLFRLVRNQMHQPAWRDDAVERRKKQRAQVTGIAGFEPESSIASSAPKSHGNGRRKSQPDRIDDGDVT